MERTAWEEVVHNVNEGGEEVNEGVEKIRYRIRWH